MLNIEPPPGGTTKPFVSIVIRSECSFDISEIRENLRPESLVRGVWTTVNRTPRPQQKVGPSVEQVTYRGEQPHDARRRELARPVSIRVAKCMGWTAAIDGAPAAAHQARNSSAAQ
jgi:hypothetical protein